MRVICQCTSVYAFRQCVTRMSARRVWIRESLDARARVNTSMSVFLRVGFAPAYLHYLRATKAQERQRDALTGLGNRGGGREAPRKEKSVGSRRLRRKGHIWMLSEKTRSRGAKRGRSQGSIAPESRSDAAFPDFTFSFAFSFAPSLLLLLLLLDRSIDRSLARLCLLRAEL
jgi:hypothetical protein